MSSRRPFAAGYLLGSVTCLLLPPADIATLASLGAERTYRWLAAHAAWTLTRHRWWP